LVDIETVTVAGVRVRGATLLYVVLEDLLIVGALLGASAFAQFGRVTVFHSPLSLAKTLLIMAGIKVAFFWSGLYSFRHVPGRTVFWRRLGFGIGFASAVAVGVWYGLLREWVAPLAFVAAFAPVVTFGRLAFEFLSRMSRFRRRVLFLGVGKEAQRTAREILDLCARDYELVGFLSEQQEGREWRIGGRNVLGTYKDLGTVVAEHRVDQVVVAVDDRRKGLPLEELLRVRLAGTEIAEEARLHEEIAGKIPVEDLRPSWLIFSEGFINTRLRNATKRAFDVAVAGLGLILSSPIALAAAIAIRLESKGPVFYRQERVGQGGKTFTLCKFRSMRQDAEAAGKPQWAQEDDPRITRVGRFLRKTRIDEIPQMWNVLEGTMSFVGPRPERPFFVEQLRAKIPFYDQRHALKPGLTGWAQVSYRYGSDEADAVEKLRLDMFYVKHHSILFDLRILLETVRVIFEADKGR
jgi:sugar transferase (PEP-CTERM system associated)